MSRIDMECHEEHFELLNPLNSFAHEIQNVQVFRDPLLGHLSVYNPAIETGLKVFLGDLDEAWLDRMVAETQANCIFCSSRHHVLARFPETLLAGGQARVCEALAFPNLFGLGSCHAVAIVSQAHFLRPNEFRPRLIADALLALRQVAIAVERHEPSAAKWLSIHANYLGPAGASQMHPHFQMIMGREPLTHHHRLASACRDWHAAHGRPYHAQLMEQEHSDGARYIAATGPWHWAAAYAPLGTNEIIATHSTQGDFIDMPDEHVESLAEGMAATLRLYQSLGYMSFNFSLYACRRPRAEDGFQILLRFMTRQNPGPNYRCDDFYLQKGLQTELMLIRPEVLATRARSCFQSRLSGETRG